MPLVIGIGGTLRPSSSSESAYGTPAAVSKLQNLRTIVHALPGLPTPYGASVVVGRQVIDLARLLSPRAQDTLTTTIGESR